MTEPLHPSPDGTGESGQGPGAEAPRASGKILVVDDDGAVGLILSRTMEKLGYEADLAADGWQALSLFEANPAQYSLVLLDFKLPGMDSRTVYRELRGRRPDMPVVLMSGYNREEALGNSAGMQFAGFLRKPFTRDSLACALSQAS